MENKNTKQNEIRKERFESPEAEVTMFGTEDIIITSGEGEYDDDTGVDGKEQDFTK